MAECDKTDCKIPTLAQRLDAITFRNADVMKINPDVVKKPAPKERRIQGLQTLQTLQPKLGQQFNK